MLKDLVPRPQEISVDRDPLHDIVMVRAPGIVVAVPHKAIASSGPPGVQVDWDKFSVALYQLLSSFLLGDTPATLADSYQVPDPADMAEEN